MSPGLFFRRPFSQHSPSWGSLSAPSSLGRWAPIPGPSSACPAWPHRPFPQRPPIRSNLGSGVLGRGIGDPSPGVLPPLLGHFMGEPSGAPKPSAGGPLAGVGGGGKLPLRAAGEAKGAAELLRTVPLLPAAPLSGTSQSPRHSARLGGRWGWGVGAGRPPPCPRPLPSAGGGSGAASGSGVLRDPAPAATVRAAEEPDGAGWRVSGGSRSSSRPSPPPPRGRETPLPLLCRRRRRRQPWPSRKRLLLRGRPCGHPAGGSARVPAGGAAEGSAGRSSLFRTAEAALRPPA